LNGTEFHILLEKAEDGSTRGMAYHYSIISMWQNECMWSYLCFSRA
jgi:hypothetical protein